MQSKIKLFLFIAALTVAQQSFADSLSDAISRQESAQAAIDASNATNMALSMHAANASGKDTPILYSVMAIGEQYVLRFNTINGSFIVTNASSDIGDKWKLVKFDGLSVLIQRGSEKPVRVYLSVPDDIEQAQTASTTAIMPPIPPMSQ